LQCLWSLRDVRDEVFGWVVDGEKDVEDGTTEEQVGDNVEVKKENSVNASVKKEINLDGFWRGEGEELEKKGDPYNRGE
jgi:hypothetical protein